MLREIEPFYGFGDYILNSVIVMNRNSWSKPKDALCTMVGESFAWYTVDTPYVTFYIHDYDYEEFKANRAEVYSRFGIGYRLRKLGG